MGWAALPNCECGEPVYIKKRGECRSCYMQRWRSENPDRLAAYASKPLNPEQAERKRAKAQARYRAIADQRLDQRPIEVVILEKTESAFVVRERHLLKRREWNAKNVDARREYRRTAVDSTKAERNRRAADQRELETGRRSHLSSRMSGPERLERQRRWRDENRAYINAQQREYRSR